MILRERYVVVDKPSGLSVHRGWDDSRDTMMTRVRNELGRWVYPVHRLDRATSGVLVMALDPEAASALSESFRNGLVEKEYLALVRGPLRTPGTIDHPIPTHVSGERTDAITDYEPLETVRDRYTLVRVRPRSGKRHQIRLHFRHLRAPLLGDTTYGDGKENRKLRDEIGLHRLALHASRIAFPDPVTGVREAFDAPLPDDLAEPLRRLGLSLALG